MQSIPDDADLAVAVTEAIQAGDVQGLKALLEENAGLCRTRIVDRQGGARTLLHIAADWPGHFPNGPETVRALIDAGSDVDAAMVGGNAAETPLHWAASSNDVAVLDALLDGGADIEMPGAIFTGGTAMSDAVVFAQWNAARRLLERGSKTTIWQAAALGLLDAVKQYVSAEPIPSGREITNALWHACRGGQLAVVQYLVEQGGDVNWVGYDSKTPLDVAKESDVADLVRWLEQNGTML